MGIPQQPPTERAPGPAKPRILCVDDEPFVLEGLRDTLRRSFDVRTATSGAEGLALLKAEGDAIAIVISDMRMPVMQGDTFLREARTISPSTVRMLLTGQADLDAAISVVNQAQLFRFLTKPCEPDDLMRACAGALAQHRLITAERVLLQQTLRGCVDALAGILALTNPAAFGRGGRVKELVAQLAAAPLIDNLWEAEVAAMLAPIGAVTLPQAVAEKLYSGELLSEDESEMAERVPEVTHKLLAKIPRLEGVLEILDTYRQEIDAGDFAAVDAMPAGARALRIASDYDELESHGSEPAVAVGTMSSRRIYDTPMLDALARAVGAGERAPVVAEIPLARLEVGMRLATDVRNVTGGLLVARGQDVTTHMIDRLTNLGADHVHQPITIFQELA